MTRRTGLLYLFTLWNWVQIQAQEVRTPLGCNRFLNSDANTSQISLHKSGMGFPFLDYFSVTGKPSAVRWLPGNATVANRLLVLNAQDSTGISYVNPGLADELISVPMDIRGGQAFLSFHVSSGNTWQAGDSLVLSWKNKLGLWEPVWHTVSQENNLEVHLDINPGIFSSDFFALNWSLFTLQNNPANTQTYTLANVVVAYKWNLPFHDHLRQYHLPDSTPVRDYFASPDTRIIPGTRIGYPWGNCAQLNVRRIDSSIYANGDGSFGGADTFLTHPFDGLNLEISDSVHFGFLVRPSQINNSTDSLVVEFRNNLNEWIRMLVIPGTANANRFVSFNFPVNYGRFRHSGFQARFILLTTRLDANAAAWYVSGFSLVKRIVLPFFDDFSNSRIRVSPERWSDSYVYVNNEFPVNHPSLNVATFDGLDANGNAYSKFPTKGTCDKLTSWPINLKGLNASDSVILSFYYQYEPQGTTDQVYPDDSLIIELRNSPFDKDSFTVLKMIAAADTLLNRFTYFEQVLTNPVFFHEDLQIRIRNRGSLTGNLSQWHVDYIRFNKGRRRGDAIKDIALTNTPRIYLGPYTSMPWYQYQVNPPAFLHGADELRLVNHDDQPYAVDYFRSMIRPEGDTLDKFNNILPTIEAQNDSTVSVNKSFLFSSTQSGDSLVFQTKYRIKISGNQNDNVTGNDTAEVPVIFSNYLAYDDGSAEGGYGVKNKLNVGACLKFGLAVPDSIVGVYIFFNQSEKDVSTQRFNIKVWRKISPLFLPATSDQVIYNQEVQRPIYTNTINGFASFRFQEPIPVQDSFYIGWDQISSYVLNVGLDKNYRFGVNPNMAYKMDGRWYPAEIPGALMIRPILKNFLGSASGLKLITASSTSPDWKVYPNPASNQLFIEGPDVSSLKLTLYDLQGKQLANLDYRNGNAQLPGLVSGLYLLILEDPVRQIKQSRKIMISN